MCSHGTSQRALSDAGSEGILGLALGFGDVYRRIFVEARGGGGLWAAGRSIMGNPLLTRFRMQCVDFVYRTP